MTSHDPMSPERLRQRVEAVIGQQLHRPPRLVRDTSQYMNIERDDVLELGGQLYVVRANEREGRFTIEDQPKFWVKRVMSLATGGYHIVKLSFEESFKIRIAGLQIPCHRSADKESAVLARMAGDPRFMQGCTVPDGAGNPVRLIDYIHGDDLLSVVDGIELSHQAYFETRFPAVLAAVTECFRAIAALHRHGLCHGDIRNDHIFVERDTGRYRWIDFDLTQPYGDYDVWSAGNILHSIVSKGFVTFRDVAARAPAAFAALGPADGSLFFPHRVMNLGRVFPYVPADLNRILLRFSVGTDDAYDDMDELVDELTRCAARHRWPTAPAYGGGTDE